MDSYPIIIKRKKPRKNTKRFNKVQIPLPPGNHDIERFFIGEFILGQFTEEQLSKKFNHSTCFDLINSHSHVDILSRDDVDVLEIMSDETCLYAITIQVDTPFILALMKSKQFYLQLSLNDNVDVLVKVYFKEEPCAQSQTAIKRQLLRQLFQVLFGVGVSPLSESDKTSEEDVENTLQAIRNKQLELLQENCTSPGDFHQSKWLKSPLRPYQEAGVKWMLNKEKTAQSASKNIQMRHPGYVEVQLPAMTVYMDQEQGYVILQPPEVEVCTIGGILADEMGLGKTIEVLALILSDFDGDDEARVKSVAIHRQRKRPAYEVADLSELLAKDANEKVREEPGSNKERLMQLYQNVLVSAWATRHKVEQEVACICGSFVKKKLRECIDCGKKQHLDCVGYDASCGPFRCSQCWSKQEPLPSKGTLIVCPPSLCEQWLSEISKHVVCNLQVFCYDGSNVLTPVYPTKLARYDIVVTTYSVLQSEFYQADQSDRSLRHQRKYSSPGCPITMVQFRRLCLDEAQTVESTSSMIAAMAQRLRADFRWAITGTPVSTSIADLYGLVEYLHLAPYDDRDVFDSVLYHPYLRGDDAPLVTFLAGVLWRTRKCDVLAQINIPPQTVEHHLVEFTQVERYFYDSEAREAKHIFLERARAHNSATQLKRMQAKELKELLQPISALRRVCVHHNVVKGKYLLTKKSVNSMQELLDALIARNVNDCNDHLRAIVAGNNGLAGVYLLLNNPLVAAAHYVKVMQVEEKYAKHADAEKTALETAITLDKLPLIHMYYNLRPLVLADAHLSHNLSELLKMEVTLSAEELKARQEMLELAFTHKYEHQTRQVLQALGETSNHLLDVEATIAVPNWYADLQAAISEAKLNKVMNHRVQNLLQSLPNTNFRPSSSFNIEFILNWIALIKTMREEALTAVSDLYEITAGDRIVFTEEVVQETVKCHLRPENTRKKKHTEDKECAFCAANKLLGQYEKHLYLEGESETGKQKNWQASIQQDIISTVLKLASRKASPDALQSGKAFLEMLELQKKQFREVRKLWAYLEAQLCANDELVMCKTRLQLKNSDEDEVEEVHRSLKQLSNEIKSNLEGINELTEFEVDGYRFNLEADIRAKAALLEKCLGTNKYLISLHSSDQKLDPCPICRCPLEKSWNIMRCGHAFCLICMQTMIGRNNANPANSAQKITCAVCRQVQPLADIDYVDESLNTPETSADAVIGNCSSKVERIVRLIKQLKREQDDVKVLVFTSFLPVLKILKDIFEENGITAVVVNGNSQLDKRVQRFKQTDVTALVLPVNLGAKGLNLIEATHVIFAEPILDPAEELQAIGRVHRIGQKKETVVHKFIMNDSIEAGIRRATSSKDKSKWSRAEITVGQLKDLLFGSWETEESAMIED